MKIQLHTTCIGTPAKTGVQSALVLKFAYSINAFREVLQVHYQGMRISENRKKIQDSTDAEVEYLSDKGHRLCHRLRLWGLSHYRPGAPA